MSVNIVSQFQSSTFGHELTLAQPAQRSPIEIYHTYEFDPKLNTLTFRSPFP